MIRLEGTITGQAQVLGLLLSQLGQLHIQLSQVGFSHCFIQLERNIGRCRISVLLWDPLPATSYQQRQELLCWSIRHTCYTYYLILASQPASLDVLFLAAQLPFLKREPCNLPPPSSPGETIDYISFLTLHQPKQLPNAALEFIYGQNIFSMTETGIL